MFHKRFAVLTLVGLVGFSVSMRAQGNSSQAGTGPLVDPVVQQNILDWAVQRRGLPADWTHHYLVFSNPGTAEQATASGNYEHWLKVVNSPRFTMQQIKRSGGVAGLAGWAIGSGEGPTPVLPNPVRPGPVAPIPPIKWKNPIKKDWNVQIGGTVASATGTITPAFSASGSSTVTINGTAVTGSAPAAATATGTFTASAPASGQNITIQNPADSNTLTLSTNATVGTATGTVAVPAMSGWSISIINGALATPNTFTLTPGTASRTTYLGTYGTGFGTGTVTIKDSVYGNTLTLTAQGVSDGCTSPNTGTFIIAGGAQNVNAQHLAAAIANCYSSYNQVGVTASYLSGNQFTVYDSTLAGCGKTRFEADGVPRNSLVSTAQPDKKKACVEKTSSSWMCLAT